MTALKICKLVSRGFLFIPFSSVCELFQFDIAFKLASAFADLFRFRNSLDGDQKKAIMLIRALC